MEVQGELEELAYVGCIHDMKAKVILDEVERATRYSKSAKFFDLCKR